MGRDNKVTQIGSTMKDLGTYIWEYEIPETFSADDTRIDGDDVVLMSSRGTDWRCSASPSEDRDYNDIHLGSSEAIRNGRRLVWHDKIFPALMKSYASSYLMESNFWLPVIPTQGLFIPVDVDTNGVISSFYSGKHCFGTTLCDGLTMDNVRGMFIEWFNSNDFDEEIFPLTDTIHSPTTEQALSLLTGEPGVPRARSERSLADRLWVALSGHTATWHRYQPSPLVDAVDMGSDAP